MSLFVYLLCAMTSLACAVLLLRSYRRSRIRLLLWSGLCFACLCASNVMVIVDVRVVPARDLSVLRIAPSLLGIALLIYGFIWDSAE